MAYFDPLPPRDQRLFIPPPSTTPVLIVGSGPVGLVTAYLLARHNVKCTIIERHALRLGQPKAHAINARSLEILRQAGLDTGNLRREGVPAEEGDKVRFLTTLVGEEIGSLPYERQDEAVKELTPEPLFNIAQPVLEKCLQDAALETGMVTIHRRQEWIRYEVDGTYGLVKSVVRDRDSLTEMVIKSAFVIGADGTNSTVRKKIPGAHFEPVDPSTGPMNYVSVHCTLDIDPLVDGRAAQLYFFCSPTAKHSGLIGYKKPHWVYARPIPEANNEPLDYFTVEKCRNEINAALGKDWPCKIHSVQTWTTSRSIANTYADSNLKVFLAGDSAHAFPPMGGLGVNTGIADAHNLVWKIKYVLDGHVAQPQKLLSTYTTERKPVATANAIQSTVNEIHMRQLDAESIKVLAEAELSGSRSLTEILKDPRIKGPIAAAIEKNRDHFDSLGLQLGYIYNEDAQQKKPHELLRKDCSCYEPEFEAGSRLPHAWLPPALSGVADGEKTLVSTLDLVHEYKFTLFTRDGRFACQPSLMKAPLSVVNVEERDIPRAWIAAAGIDGSTSLLVRPDQHVLGRFKSSSDLEEAIKRYLGN